MLFKRLRDAEYPEGYQVLCHNCNNSKADLGECVHKRESQFGFIFDTARKSKRKGPKSVKGRVDESCHLKRCTTCLDIFPATVNYFSKRKNGYLGLKESCKKCYSKYRHEYVKEVRYKALQHFSGGCPECASCNESEPEFLCVDHLEGGGRKHRSEMGNGHQVSSVNGFLKIMKDPDKGKYQVLCWNCNYSKHHYGS